MNKIVPLSQGIAHSFLSANVASGTETTTKINSMKSSFGIVAVVFAFQDELFLSKLEFHLNTPRDEIFKVFHNHLEVKTDVLIQFKKRTLSENEENSRLPTAMETDTNVAADRAEEEEDDDEIATLQTNGSSRSSSHPGFEQYRELQQQQDRSHPQRRQRRWCRLKSERRRHCAQPTSADESRNPRRRDRNQIGEQSRGHDRRLNSRNSRNGGEHRKGSKLDS
jgi:hypothetical protein